jgi:hypothetical protein
VRVTSGQPLAALRLTDVPAGFARAELRLEGLKPPVESFEARFFADEPEAGAQTPKYGNPHFLASQFFYGLGVANEAAASQSAPTEIRVNITDELRRFLAIAPRAEFSVSVVALDRQGNLIAEPDLELKGVSFEFL